MKVDPISIQLKNGTIVSIRSANANDAENMLIHLKLAHSESYRNLNQSAQFWDSVSTENEAKILTDFELSDHKLMLVADYEEKIVGGLGMFGPMQEFVKHNLSIGMSIQSRFGNQGLGTQMMKIAIETAKKSGFHRLDLTVRTYNTNAIRLYEKMGFKKIGLLSDAALIDGRYVDEFSYQLLI